MASPTGARERARRTRQSARDKGERAVGKVNGHTATEGVMGAAWEDLTNATTIEADQHPEVLRVTFHEYIERLEEGPDGQMEPRRRRTERTAEIDTFVPAAVIDEVLQEVDQIPEALRQAVGKSVPLSFFKSGDQVWIYRQVLRVWQLSEPRMTLPRLMGGIEFPQVLGLFGQLYARPLMLMNKKEQAQGDE